MVAIAPDFYFTATAEVKETEYAPTPRISQVTLDSIKG